MTWAHVIVAHVGTVTSVLAHEAVCVVLHPQQLQTLLCHAANYATPADLRVTAGLVERAEAVDGALLARLCTGGQLGCLKRVVRLRLVDEDVLLVVKICRAKAVECGEAGWRGKALYRTLLLQISAKHALQRGR